MNFDKKTMMAFLFIGLIIILTQSDWYKKTFFPELYKQQKLRKEHILENKAITPTDSVNIEKSNIDTILVNDKNSDETVVEKVQYEELLDGVENEVKIETELYSAVLSNIGGRIKSFRLKNYLTKDSTFVELIGKQGKENLDIAFENEEDEQVYTNRYFFKLAGNSATIRQGKSHQIKYVLDFGNERKIEKIYTFYGHRYDIDLEVNFLNFGTIISRPYYQIRWGSGLASTEQSLKDDMMFAKAYAMIGEEVQKYDVKKKSEEEKAQEYGEDNVKWAGQRTKYFSAVIIPEDEKAHKVIFGGHKEKIEEQNNFLKVFSVSLEMPFERATSLNKNKFKIFIGPLDYELVKSYNIGLDKMMNWGWAIIKPFSMAVLWSLKKLHGIIPNYGLVIIIFSILVKILLYPLTHKSYQSMHAMQALQPKVNALKEKYGNDQKRLNEETMKLYKTEGVNPVGGCLPMFFQMPILYSLFIIFKSTIELRAASFVWWINDLSMPDTIFTLGFNIPMYGNKVNVLPIIMGVTMLIQQKMSMKDPKQKAMVYMMPAFFTLLFNQFPSGLNLYYSLFNVFSIFQQKFVADKQSQVATIAEPKKQNIKKRKK